MYICTCTYMHIVTYTYIYMCIYIALMHAHTDARNALGVWRNGCREKPLRSRMGVYTCMYIHILTYIYIYIYMYTYIPIIHAYTYARDALGVWRVGCLEKQLWSSMYTYTCIYKEIYTYLYTYIHVYIRKYIHIYIHIYMYMIHAYIHTQVHRTSTACGESAAVKSNYGLVCSCTHVYIHIIT